MLGSLLESKLDLVMNKIGKPTVAEGRDNLPVKHEAAPMGPAPSSPPRGIVMVKDELMTPPRAPIMIKDEPEMSPLRHHPTLGVIDLITEEESHFMDWVATDDMDDPDASPLPEFEE
eukprot:3820023-Amphidinium_carterae.1